MAGETPQQMDVARWAGVSAVGSPRNLNHRLIVEGISSSVVLQTPTGAYYEVAILATTAISATLLAVPNPDDPRANPGRVAMLGDDVIPNCALWARADAATWLTLARASDGVKMDIGVSTLGSLAAVVGGAIDERQTDITRMGPEIADPRTGIGGISRVWVRSGLGKPSGVVLQDTNGTPWVVWVDSSGALRTTNWSTFLLGLLAATGATAGIPGTFTPAGSAAPANLAAMTGITASPTTAWTTGQYVALLDGSFAYWSSTAWTAGKAP